MIHVYDELLDFFTATLVFLFFLLVNYSSVIYEKSKINRYEYN